MTFGDRLTLRPQEVFPLANAWPPFQEPLLPILHRDLSVNGWTSVVTFADVYTAALPQIVHKLAVVKAFMKTSGDVRVAYTV